jgi:hypothetical protein
LTEESNVVDVNNETARTVSESVDRAETMGRRVGQATQRSFSETLDRAEASGQRLNQTAQGLLDEMSLGYQTLFSFRGARKLAEAYIEVNERMAKESLDFNRRFVELWFEGARKFWQAAEEGRREATSPS